RRVLFRSSVAGTVLDRYPTLPRLFHAVSVNRNVSPFRSMWTRVGGYRPLSENQCPMNFSPFGSVLHPARMLSRAVAPAAAMKCLRFIGCVPMVVGCQ